MERNGKKLQDLAMNVIFETSTFQDAYDVSDSKQFAMNCDLIMNNFIEKHGTKELYFNLLFSLFESEEEEKTSAIYLDFLKIATETPYRATEAIALTLTKYMVATEAVSYTHLTLPTSDLV